MLQFPDLGPKRFEVVIGEGHLDDGVFLAAGDGAFEPEAGLVQLLQLAGVAGEVVGDDGFGGKFLGGGQEGIPGLGQAAFVHTAEGVGAMQIAGGIVGLDGDLGAGDLEGIAPALRVGVNGPADIKDVRVLLVVRGDLVEFGLGVRDAAQSEPADGGIKEMGVGRFKFLHKWN
jgi:hypothetical protein